MPKGGAQAPRITALSVPPKQRLLQERSPQRRPLTAQLPDGTSRDVTNEALYSSNDDSLAHVDSSGRIWTTILAGESAIVVRYHDHVAACFVTVPLNHDAAATTHL